MYISQFKHLILQKRQWLCALLVFCGELSYLHAEEKDDGYQFELTPYLWAARIKGTTATNGEEPPPIDSGYNFFSMDNLDGVASATFSARKNKLAFLFDYLYVGYEDTFLQATPLQVTTRLEGTVIEFAGTYAPSSLDHVEFIAGLRRQNITVSLTLLNKNPEQSKIWNDPFAGIIYSYPLNKKFHMTLRGDLGGFGISSERAVNAEAMFRYQMSKTFSIKFGYRYLKVKFEDTDFLYDLSLDGYKLGLGILF